MSQFSYAPRGGISSFGLIRLLLKNLLRSRREGKAGKATLVVVLCCFAPILIALCVGLYFITAEIIKIGRLSQLLTLLYFSSQIVTLFLATQVLLSTVYSSSDNEYFAPLPISPTKLFFCKMAVVYLSELMLSAAILIPSLISIIAGVYGHDGSLAWQFFLLSPLQVVLTPLLPLLLASIIAIPLVYISTYFKRRAALGSIAGILLIILLFGGYFGLVTFLPKAIEAEGVMMTDKLLKALDVTAKIAYFDNVGVLAALGNGVKVLADFAIYVAIIIGACALATVFAKLFYSRAVKSMFESSVSHGEGESKLVSHSVVVSLLRKDVKSLLRYPSLAVTSLMSVFMAPLMLTVMYFMTGGKMFDIGEGTTATLLNTDVMNSAMLMFYTLCLSTDLNYVAMLSFSREGESFYAMKHLPISREDYILSKRIFAAIISVAGILIIVILMLALFKVGIVDTLLLLALSLIMALGFNDFSIASDMKRPNFHWQTINEVSKRNVRIMLPFLVGIGIGIAGLVLGGVAAYFMPVLGAIGAKLLFWLPEFALAVGLWVLFAQTLKRTTAQYYDKMGDEAPIQPVQRRLDKWNTLGK